MWVLDLNSKQKSGKSSGKKKIENLVYLREGLFSTDTNSIINKQQK